MKPSLSSLTTRVFVLRNDALREAGEEVASYEVRDGGHGTHVWTPAVLPVVREFLDEHL